ncbi:MAG: hypothetical protein MSH12_12720 [Romboutsia timonensis]|nr:hypothetical protein [Romboutsia timonensis]
MSKYEFMNLTVESVKKEIEGADSDKLANIIVNLRKRANKLDDSLTNERLKVFNYRNRIEELEERLKAQEQLVNVEDSVCIGNSISISELESKNKELESNVSNLKEKLKHKQSSNTRLKDTIKDLESTISKLKADVVSMEEVNKELELLKEKDKSRKPPARYHRKGTVEFYRDLKKCAELVEIKVNKNGKQYESWVKVLEALRKEQTIMNYIDAYDVELTRDNVKRWLRVANGDGSVSTKEYNASKGYKR